MRSRCVALAQRPSRGHTDVVATISVEVETEVMPYLHALAVVRGCEVEDLLKTALTHLRVTQAERQRVAFYRHVAETGSSYADGVYRS